MMALWECYRELGSSIFVVFELPRVTVETGHISGDFNLGIYYSSLLVSFPSKRYMSEFSGMCGGVLADDDLELLVPSDVLHHSGDMGDERHGGGRSGLANISVLRSLIYG